MSAATDTAGRLAFRIPEAAEAIGVSRGTIYAAIKSGISPISGFPAVACASDAELSRNTPARAHLALRHARGWRNGKSTRY